LRNLDEPQHRLASLADFAELKSATPATAGEKITAGEPIGEDYAQDREDRPSRAKKICLKKIVQAHYRNIRAVNLFRSAA
jgi:hypothetical protein